MKLVSDHSVSAGNDLNLVRTFFQNYKAGAPEGHVVADLTFGNPHEPPLPELVSALRTHIEPLTTDWFAYKFSEAEPRRVIAEGLRAELGLNFAPEDIAMTLGAYGAIALAFSILLDPGDECIIPVPGWFLYETSLSLCHDDLCGEGYGGPCGERADVGGSDGGKKARIDGSAEAHQNVPHADTWEINGNAKIC